MNKARVIALLVSFPVAVSFVPLFDAAKNSTLLFMQPEYKVIQSFVTELATANDLGSQPIRFSVVAGPTLAFRAHDLNLCRRDRESCFQYLYLNPFKGYRGKNRAEIGEALNQAMAFGGLVGFVDHQSRIGIARSSFFETKHNKNDMECLISHEISHYLSRDSFHNQMDAYLAVQDGSELEESILRKKFRRESEVNADISASKMLFNIGRPLDLCVFARQRWLQLNPSKIETSPSDSYFGYQDWMAALFDFIEESRINPIKKLTVQTSGKWHFDRRLNVLTFVPGRGK